MAEPAHPDSTRPPAAWIAGALVALAVAVNLPATTGGFFSDDQVYVVNNRALAAIPVSRLWRVFTQWNNPWEYLPVRDLSYRLDLALFGPSAPAFHAVNLLVYGLACAAAFLAIRSVLRLLRGARGDRFEAVAVVAATAVFALHPAHVEATAWVASRKDLLSGLFVLASTWQFAEAIAGEAVSSRRLAWAALLFAAALLSKASALPLVGLVLLLAAARYREGAPARTWGLKVARVAAPFLTLAAGSLVLSSGFAAATLTRAGTEYVAPTGPIALALRILGAFVEVAAAPVSLRLHHDVRADGPPGGVLILLGTLAALAALWGAWALVRRRSLVGFGLVTFVGFTVPYLQLLPFAAWSEMCERWLFVPIAGLAVLVGVVAARLAAGPAGRLVFAAAALLAASGAAATAHRSWEWGSEDRLVHANLARAAGHWGAVALAAAHWDGELRFRELRAEALRVRNPAFRERVLLIAAGWQAIAEHRPEEARRVMAQLSSLSPFPPLAWPEAGLALRTGQDFEAVRILFTAGMDWRLTPIRERYRPRIEALQRELDADPGDVDRRAELGNLQSELWLNGEAEASYRQALRLRPDRADVRYNLAMVVVRDARFAEAAAEYRAVAAVAPMAWNDVAICERRLGRRQEAERAFRMAIAADERAWKPALNLAISLVDWGRQGEARDAFLVARRRALAAGAPVGSIDERLARLAP